MSDMPSANAAPIDVPSYCHAAIRPFATTRGKTRALHAPAARGAMQRRAVSMTLVDISFQRCRFIISFLFFLSCHCRFRHILPIFMAFISFFHHH